jgi:hypothetical protein
MQMQIVLNPMTKLEWFTDTYPAAFVADVKPSFFGQ